VSQNGGKKKESKGVNETIKGFHMKTTWMKLTNLNIVNMEWIVYQGNVIVAKMNRTSFKPKGCMTSTLLVNQTPHMKHQTPIKKKNGKSFQPNCFLNYLLPVNQNLCTGSQNQSTWPLSCLLKQLTLFVGSDELPFGHFKLAFGSSHSTSSAY